MQSYEFVLARLSDVDLLAEVKRLAARERAATAELIASLVECDERKLYLAAGYSSLFTFCVHALGLSEASAYFRIEAARAARKFPLILERLAEGAVTLTAVKLLAPHFTSENHQGLLHEARGRTKRDVEQIVARIAPRPDVPSLVRKLPAPQPASPVATAGASNRGPGTATADGGQSQAPVSPAAAPRDSGDLFLRSSAAARSAEQPASSPADLNERSAADFASRTHAATRASRTAIIAPLAPDRYKIQMTVSAETRAKLIRLQDLLRHQIPDGDPPAIFDRALTALLAHVERTKCAATSRAVGERKSRAAQRQRRSRDRAADVASSVESETDQTNVSDGPELAPATRADRRHKAAGRGVATQPTHTPRSAEPYVEPACERHAYTSAEDTELVPERVDARGRRHAPSTSGERGPEPVGGHPDPAAVARRHQSRYIPAAVKREVWRRDKDRCTFVGTDGRCRETGMLECHHVVPYANGGEATVSNLRLACKQHNQWEAERFFGEGRPPGRG